MSIDELRAKREELKTNTDITLRNMKKISDESYRVADVAHNAGGTLSALDKEFEDKTGLQGADTAFLFCAIGLQLLRITLINELTKVEPAGQQNKIENELHDFQEKVMDKLSKSAKDISTDNKDYYASTKQIISTTGVPYDAQEYLNDQKLSLFKGANHRFSTLGHDPLIGLVIGTANILTNTITCVKSSLDIGSLEIPVLTTNHIVYTDSYSHPMIGLYGSTAKTLACSFKRITDEPVAFVAALIKQIIHIGTDMFTTYGIQFPGANLILSNTNVERITKNVGFGDIVKVGISAVIAELINAIIRTLHTLVHDMGDGIEPELYKVRTRKIILYSNAIATGSNVICRG